MVHNKVIEVGFDQDYLISKSIAAASFSDNFRLVSSRLHYVPEPKDAMIAFFLSFPKSFKFLLNTREFIAKLLGLKTAPKSKKEAKIEKLYQFKGNIGESIAIFEVLDKNAHELLTGQKDSHLDFKLSFIVYKNNDVTNLEMATTVLINNKLGKLYFGIVKPFHKFYTKRILKRMELNLINKNW
ncbi:DUF2867 domain-containing protein [Tenacibaculum amylolyticum]|uniref:DUF2867 domain-containing protein n=1 Tax=Tenacibaculum amylolyticum TaxID=104269 RepID=UPI003893DE6E